MRHKPPPPSFPDPTQTNKRASQLPTSLHDITKKSKCQEGPESPKETKRENKKYLQDLQTRGKRTPILEKKDKNGFTLPRRPRSSKPLHSPSRHHHPNPTVPALTSRAPAPSRRNPDSLPCKRRQPAFDADSAGRASCECDGG